MHDANGTLDDVTGILNSLSKCRSLVRDVHDSFTNVRLNTSGFEIACRCKLGGQRLSDVLNQSLSSYLDCHDAKLYRDGRLIDTIPHFELRKPELLVAGIQSDVHEAAEKRLDNRRDLKRFHAVAAIDRWLIKGCLHLSSQKTVQEFLHANREFFPICDALVIDAESGEAPEPMKVVIVNHTRVSFMEITELADEPEHAAFGQPAARTFGG